MVGSAQSFREASDLEREITERFGLLPNFFRLTPETPQISVKIWEFAQTAYLDNPLPSLFKERLFVYLSRFCEVRYCVARHVGFLVGLGRPSGDAKARSQTVLEVMELLKRPFPRGDRLQPFLSLEQNRAPLAELPDVTSDLEEAFFAIVSHIFLQTSEAAACYDALKALLDPIRLQYLILYLSFIRDVHYWTNFHPGLAFEEDIQQFLAKHEGLRESILHDPLAITAKASSDAVLAVRESEDLLRLAAEAGNMLAYVWDAATDQIVRSDGVTQILGEGEGTHTTGQHILSMIPPDDRERLKAAIAQLTPGNPFLHIRYRMVRSDGSVVWVNRTSRAYFDQQGRLQRMIGMLADITDRMRVEEALASVSGQLIEAQEKERNRIGRELHDNTNQRLGLLAVEVEQLKNIIPRRDAEVRLGLVAIHKQILEIAVDIQALAHELHSSTLEYLGLELAMKSFCKEFGDRHEVGVDFKSDGVPRSVPPEISLCLFRVMQEGLRNALKHSGVRTFEVKLHGSPVEIRLTVRDSGVGSERDLSKDIQGLGLISMQERVRLVKGTISIISNPMSGTAIDVRVPLSAAMQTQDTRLAGH
jgi:PAS domain S-box-containing protein